MADDAGQQSTISSSRKSGLPRRGISRRILVVWFTAVILAEVVASGVTWPSVLHRFQALSSRTNSPPPTPIVGHVLFRSSPHAQPGNLNEVQITLPGIPDAPAGKTYYAWLEYNRSSTLPIHWPLTVQIDSLFPSPYTYTDQTHRNLLANMPYLFLITLQSQETGSPPFDPSQLRYYANISQTTSSMSFPIMPCPQSNANNICIP